MPSKNIKYRKTVFMDFIRNLYYNLFAKKIKRVNIMKKFLYDKEFSVSAENNKSEKLQYFLIENEIEIDSNIVTCYGFEVKKTSNSASGELSEVKRIPNVFFNRHEAAELLKKIAEGKTTPIALSGILEDYMSDAIYTKKRLPILV